MMLNDSSRSVWEDDKHGSKKYGCGKPASDNRILEDQIEGPDLGDLEILGSASLPKKLRDW